MSFWHKWFGIPCEHEYDHVADLKDCEEHTRAITAVRMCRKCGHTIEKTFRSPEPTCIHKWVIHKERKLKDEYGDTIGDAIVLRCENCGDIDERRHYDENK